MSRAVLALLGTLCLVGCEGGSARNHGGGTDLAGSQVDLQSCTTGAKRCDGTTFYLCDSTGREVLVEDCAQRSDAPVCVDGYGCRACQPDSKRCSADAKQIETCAADGTAYAASEDCTTSGGVCDSGLCVERCTNEASYLGCSYLAVPLANSQLDASFPYAVVLANPQSYAVTATITGGSLGSPKQVLLEPRGMSGDVQTVELPWVSKLLQKRSQCYQSGATDPLDCVARSADVPGGAYQIKSDGPIAAYQFNPLRYVQTGLSLKYSYSNDASLLLPEVALGKHYLALTYGNWSNETLGPYSENVTLIHGGLVAIAATTNATTVTVQLTATVYDPANESAELAPGTYDFTLDRGEVLQLLGKKGSEDLTGTRIVASSPVATFVGHDCTQIPDGRPACDHLEEQLLPQQAWGKAYAVSPLRVRSADEVSVVRILSQSSNNQLAFDGITPPPACAAPLGNGQWCEFESATPFQVSAAGSFLVAQFMRGQGDPPHKDEICVLHKSDSECAAFTGGPQQWCSVHYTDPLCEGYIKWCSYNPSHASCQGDPGMVFEAPIAQYRSSYDLLVPSTYPVNRLNVVAPTGSNVTLDGTPLPTVTDVQKSTIGAGFDLYVLPVSSGRHHLDAADGSRFGVKVYGVATYTSYVYAGGLDLEALEVF